MVYEQQEQQQPVLAIELEGRERMQEELVQKVEKQKLELCKAFDMQMIRVENSYARRYNYIKEILTDFFSARH